MDVYLIISLAFVFLALVELALVIMAKKMLEISMKRTKVLRSISNNCSSQPLQEPEITTRVNRITSIQIDYQRQQGWESGQAQSQNKEEEGENTNGTERMTIMQSIFTELSMTNKLDFLAFIFFNLAYLVFNAIYFLNLLNTSN